MSYCLIHEQVAALGSPAGDGPHEPADAPPGESGESADSVDCLRATIGT